MMGFEEIIKEEDLLEVLQIGEWVLSHLRTKRGFPFVSLARGKRVYLASDVLKWLKENSSKVS